MTVTIRKPMSIAGPKRRLSSSRIASVFAGARANAL